MSKYITMTCARRMTTPELVAAMRELRQFNTYLARRSVDNIKLVLKFRTVGSDLMNQHHQLVRRNK